MRNNELPLRALHFAWVVALLLLGTIPGARAQESSPSARAHFDRGYALAESGDATAAIREFEKAYAISPNASVLYNLGQAYAAAGRSSEAIETLERYLALNGSSVSEARRLQVQAMIAFHAPRVGKLVIDAQPPTATLWMDGRALGKGSREILLNAGKHHLIATAPGFEPSSVEPEIVAAGKTTLEVHLRPLPPPAQVSIVCPLEDVAVYVDGVLRGRTPAFVNFATTNGSHRVRFERAGYLPNEQEVELVPGSSRSVSCVLSIDPRDSTRGRLLVRHPRGTTVFLNGAAFRDSLVPPGAHRVRVEGPGYTSETWRVVVRAREELVLTLRPPREPRAEALARERSREALRKWAYVLAGVTLAGGTTAAALYIDNNSRYASWQSRSQKSIRTLPDDPDAPRSLDALLAEEDSIRRRDAVALGLAIFSGAALAVGAGLYISSLDSDDHLVLTASSGPELRYVHAF